MTTIQQRQARSVWHRAEQAARQKLGLTERHVICGLFILNCPCHTRLAPHDWCTAEVRMGVPEEHPRQDGAPGDGPKVLRRWLDLRECYVSMADIDAVEAERVEEAPHDPHP